MIMHFLVKYFKNTSDKINKLYLYTYKIALIILIISVGYTSFISIAVGAASQEYESVILLIGTIIYISAVSLLYLYGKKLINRQLNYISIALLIMYFFLTITIGLKIKSERPADIFNLHTAAVSYLQTGKIANPEYYAVYPMQLSYTYILIFVYKMGYLLGINDYRTSGTIFGALCLLFSAILMYKIACKIKNKNVGILSLFIFTTNPIFWIYSSYYYTDLIGMLLILLSLNLALYISEKRNEIVNLLACFFLGIVVLVGFKMRATVAIGGIACLLLGIVKYTNSREKTALIRYFIFFCFGCISALIVYYQVGEYFNIELDRNRQFPITHWIMMGLSEKNNGKYSSELWRYTNSFPSYTEKIQANIEKIKYSLSNMGLLNLVKLFARKLVIMWSDGRTALVTNFKTSVHYGSLYEYMIGNKSCVTNYILQIMRSSLLICSFPYMLYEIREKFSKKSLLTLTFFGYMIFYFFWEAHEKYALMFLPILIVIAACGIALMFETLDNYLVEEKTKKLRPIFLRALKIIFTVISISTFLLYARYWNDMVKKTEKRYNFVVNQSTASSSIKIGNTEIKQTFIAEQKFNSIYVMFKNNTVPKEQQYMFLVYDNNNTCIYHELFTAKDVKDETYHKFSFKDIYTSKEEKFCFAVKAVEEYEDPLEIFIAGNSYKDYYAAGAIASEKYKGDITFRVYYIEIASYYPKKFYICIGIILGALEITIYNKFSRIIKDLNM